MQELLEFCLDLPDSTAEAARHLGTMGYEHATNETATQALLLSLAIASRMDLDAMEDSFGNAAFGAASILGNSSLGEDQPAFVRDEIRVATIGLNEGTPYCIIGGPAEIVGLALGPAKRVAMHSRKGGQIIGFGFDSGHLFLSARFGREELLKTSSQFEDAELREYFNGFIAETLPEVVLQIISATIWEAH